MNKLDLLKIRRQDLLKSGSEIRRKIAELVDPESFVETDSYSFSKSEFYDGTAQGEGVVTGSATINDNAVFVIAQNAEVLSGGVTDANCKKIVKCQQKALRAGAPVIYLLDTTGVAVGEGVNVLEGIGDVLAACNELIGNCVQIAVATGDVLGSFALLYASCDFTFALKGSSIAYASPLVISAASGKNLSKAEVGGAESLSRTGAACFEAETVAEVRDSICDILAYLPTFGGDEDCTDDFNRAAPALNEKVCDKCVIDALFDNGRFLETNKKYAPEVRTGLGRIGGIAVGAIVFGGGENGVELDRDNILKIKKMLYLCEEHELPLVTLVNAGGIKADLETALTPVMKEAADLSYALYNLSSPRINVVYGKAVGLGYTLFASKSLGADYSLAFATAKISLFDTAKGAMIELAGVNEENKEKAEEKYADDNQDPINAARNGYIDDIIEPQFVRAHVIERLQILTR